MLEDWPWAARETEKSIKSSLQVSTKPCICRESHLLSQLTKSKSCWTDRLAIKSASSGYSQVALSKDALRRRHVGVGGLWAGPPPRRQVWLLERSFIVVQSLSRVRLFATP